MFSVSISNQQRNPFMLSVVTQIYDSYVNQAHVVRGNDALLKCDIPSFAADFVFVANWVDNQGSTYTISSGNQTKYDVMHKKYSGHDTAATF